MELKTRKLKDIILEQPAAAALLESKRLDYCCQGNRTLSEACLQQHLDPDEIESSLQSLFMSQNKTEHGFQEWNAEQLIEYILSEHHDYIREISPVMMAHMRKIASVHGDRHPELHTLSYLGLELLIELNDHMLKEEKILFPFILEQAQAKVSNGPKPESPFGSVANPIAMMEHEHTYAGQLLEQIFKITDGYTPPRDACTTYKVTFSELKTFEEKLHEHIHLENYLLFPMAIKMEELS